MKKGGEFFHHRLRGLQRLRKVMLRRSFTLWSAAATNAASSVPSSASEALHRTINIVRKRVGAAGKMANSTTTCKLQHFTTPLVCSATSNLAVPSESGNVITPNAFISSQGQTAFAQRFANWSRYLAERSSQMHGRVTNWPAPEGTKATASNTVPRGSSQSPPHSVSTEVVIAQSGGSPPASFWHVPEFERIPFVAPLSHKPSFLPVSTMSLVRKGQRLAAEWGAYIYRVPRWYGYATWMIKAAVFLCAVKLLVLGLHILLDAVEVFQRGQRLLVGEALSAKRVVSDAVPLPPSRPHGGALPLTPDSEGLQTTTTYRF
jgi:hypothetical protein